MHWRQYQEMQKVAEFGDRFMSYVDAGAGPAIILVHGIPTWGYLFHEMIPALEQHHRVLVPDLPGYGFSDRSDRFDRSLTRQAEHLCAWMAAIGVERALVAGHDVGGGVALRLAIAHPERVERLCLLDTVSYDSWPSAHMHDFGRPANRSGAPAAMRQLAEELRAGFAAPREELIAGLLAPYATEVGRLSLIRDAAALDANQTMELVARLPSLETATLILWGEKDAYQSVAYARRLAWDIPRSRLIVVPEAGHYCMIDKPGEVTAQILAFADAPSALAARWV